MSSVIQDSSIFDSKPLDKKNQKQKNEQELKKKLSQAIQECLSSYMLTSFKREIQHDFINKDKISVPKATLDHLNNGSATFQKLCKNIFNKKNQLIKEITYLVRSNIDQLASNVLKIFDSHSPVKQIKIDLRANHQNTELTESNKFFIVQLFSQYGLLKDYNQIDRSFLKLVNEAQKSFYQSKTKRRRSASSFQKNILQNQNEVKIFFPNMRSNKSLSFSSQLQNCQSYFSTQKRLQQAKCRLKEVQKKQFQSDQKVKGYTPKDSNFSFEQQTKETTQQHRKFKEQSSICSEFQFVDVQPQKKQQKFAIQSQFKELHQDLFIKVHKKYGQK